MQVLLDTHAWVWSFSEPERLSTAARQAVLDADAVFVSPISFYEIGQKTRLGKWPEMEPWLESLPEILRDQGGYAAPFTPEICIRASLSKWDHRDPFDRLIVATADAEKYNIVTKDETITGYFDASVIW